MVRLRTRSAAHNLGFLRVGVVGMKVPGHRLTARGAAGSCTCGWDGTAATRDDLRSNYRDHLQRMAPSALTLAELRRRAAGMPQRRQASRTEVTGWLRENRPQALDSANYWR